MFIKFMGIMLLCFIGGGIGGFASAFLEDRITFDVLELRKVLNNIVPIVFGVLNVVGFLVAFVIYFKAKKMADKWDGEEEEAIDMIERLLNYPVLISTAIVIVNFPFQAILMELSGLTGEDSLVECGYMYYVGTTFFVVGLVLKMVIDKLVVDLEKRLNPEKRGSVFDMQFSKRWEESCDEAQKQQIYKAGYKAFGAANIGCMVMCVITMIAQLSFKTGIFPIICVCAIWLVLNVAYCIAAMKLEGHE